MDTTIFNNHTDLSCLVRVRVYMCFSTARPIWIRIAGMCEEWKVVFSKVLNPRRKEHIIVPSHFSFPNHSYVLFCIYNVCMLYKSGFPHYSCRGKWLTIKSHCMFIIATISPNRKVSHKMKYILHIKTEFCLGGG